MVEWPAQCSGCPIALSCESVDMAQATSNQSIPPAPEWDTALEEAQRDMVALEEAQREHPCTGTEFVLDGRGFITSECGNDALHRAIGQELQDIAYATERARNSQRVLTDG